MQDVGTKRRRLRVMVVCEGEDEDDSTDSGAYLHHGDRSPRSESLHHETAAALLLGLPLLHPKSFPFEARPHLINVLPDNLCLSVTSPPLQPLDVIVMFSHQVADRLVQSRFVTCLLRSPVSINEYVYCWTKFANPLPLLQSRPSGLVETDYTGGPTYRRAALGGVFFCFAPGHVKVGGGIRKMNGISS